MPEPTYTITLTESERTAWAKVLGAFVTKLLNAPVQIDSAPAPNYISYSSDVCAPRPTTAQPSGHVPPATPELRDRWARDRHGIEVPNPVGCEPFQVHVSKAERKDLSDGRPRMKVAWQAPGGQRGYVDAACWDEKLFPFLAAASKSPDKTTLYCVHSGKYLNIVGMRA